MSANYRHLCLVAKDHNIVRMFGQAPSTRNRPKCSDRSERTAFIKHHLGGLYRYP